LYLYITCNKKILFVKKYLSLLWVFTASPFFLLLSEHKHCDNTATNSNSENARSRMVVSLRGSVGTGTKGDESSTWRIWAAAFHHVTARSGLGRIWAAAFRHVTARSGLGRIWAAAFHHVTARSGLGRVWAAAFHHVTARFGLGRIWGAAFHPVQARLGFGGM
jgi:hypothetical protein